MRENYIGLVRVGAKATIGPVEIRFTCGNKTLGVCLVRFLISYLGWGYVGLAFESFVVAVVEECVGAGAFFDGDFLVGIWGQDLGDEEGECGDDGHVGCHQGEGAFWDFEGFGMAQGVFDESL